jgi:hypothetical protein
MTMNPEIKERWLAALRSGDYIQGKSRLTTIFPDPGTGTSEERDCCLGVLCKVMEVPSQIMTSTRDADIQMRLYANGPAPGITKFYLPMLVQQAAGLEENPVLPESVFNLFPALRNYGLDSRDTQTLADLNDVDVPFALIADVIEAAL